MDPGEQEVLHSRHGGQGLYQHHIGAVVAQLALVGGTAQAQLEGLRQGCKALPQTAGI